MPSSSVCSSPQRLVYDGARCAARKRAASDGVAVAEAEAGLAVADERDRAAGPAELVALEAQQVPVAMVGGDDVAQAADAGHHLARAIVVVDDLVGDHRAPVGAPRGGRR